LQRISRRLYNATVTIAVELPDEAATSALAAAVAAMAEPGDVIALRGELGAGKTTFARAFILARGPDGEVPSPTFTLVQLYHAHGATIWHFDLYRLRSPEEAWELGIEDAFGDGISLIEWPERLGPLLPDRRLEIRLDFGARQNARRAFLAGGTGWQTRLCRIAADIRSRPEPTT
jgi:tRNA threonylcarbamoyladenosine biosynthesis protein TsaE